ncbi:MAG: hypothetical protein ACI9XO_003808 [Paraglaciecola sp.]|jgi:hypothetical protein
MSANDTILIEMQYLPPIQYFAKLYQFDKMQLEAKENYFKGTYRNRCHIAGANGLQRLSIPLRKGKNRQQSIREVEISNDEKWQSEHWHSIKSAYGNSPFFEYYVDELQPFYKKEYELLWDWNRDLVNKMMELVGIDCLIEETVEFLKPTEQGTELPVFDFRNSIQPKVSRQKEDANFKEVAYGQVFIEKHGFLPNLSILDLLFCQGPNAIEILRQSVNQGLSVVHRN